MNNIKNLFLINDGNMKRLCITHDVVDESGRVTKPNIKTNRLVTDEEVLSAISVIESYAQTLIDSE